MVADRISIELFLHGGRSATIDLRLLRPNAEGRGKKTCCHHGTIVSGTQRAAMV
ncbi:MAG: hypothetical protein M0009_07980 [Deltaproteobacteria bacterium]|nr:hypothetical protein [Deltaproteobacteria bacterium]